MQRYLKFLSNKRSVVNISFESTLYLESLMTLKNIYVSHFPLDLNDDRKLYNLMS